MKPRLNGLPFILTTCGSASALSILHSVGSQLSPNSTASASISSAFPLDDAVGVRISPRWSFSISFRPDTCTGHSEDPLVYDSTDVPAWVIFDREYLTFYGVTPAASSQNQITLTCHQGDVQLSQSFIIRVQAELRLQPALLSVLVVSPRHQVSYDLQPFISTIFIEKSKLNSTERDNISVEVGGETPWLRWDSASKRLQGTIPDSFIAIEHPTNLSAALTFTLPPAKPATTSLAVTVEPYIFTDFDYPETMVSGKFQLSLGQYIREPAELLNAVFQPPDAQAWMRLDWSNFQLSGTVPVGLGYSNASLTLSVQSLRTRTNATSTLYFSLFGTPASESPSTITRTTLALVILAGLLGVALVALVAYLIITLCFQPHQFAEESRTPGAEKEPHKAVPDVGVVRESSSGTADTLVQRSPAPPQESPVEPKSPWNGWLGLGKVLALASPKDDNTLPFTNRPPSSQGPHQTMSSSPQLNALGLIAPSETEPPTTARWAPPVPKPPPGLTPEQTAQWVDNYVCKWVEEYTGEAPGSRKRDSKHSKRTSRASQPSAGFSGTSRWEGLPNSSDQPHTLTSTVDPSHFRLATDSTPQNPDPSLLTSLPRPSIRRSASCTNSSAVSSIVPSDISSIASWDSLDSWEMERRLHYEEPRRRGDFDPTRPANPVRAGSRQRDSQARYSTEGQPPSEATDNHHRHTSEDVPSIVVTTSTEGGSSGPLSRLAQEPDEVASTSNGSSSEVPDAEDNSVYDPEGEEDVVFFPRPIGAETPGSGLARSPHLEELSRFTRSSA